MKHTLTVSIGDSKCSPKPHSGHGGGNDDQFGLVFIVWNSVLTIIVLTHPPFLKKKNNTL
jgi:hypothetical protein